MTGRARELAAAKLTGRPRLLAAAERIGRRAGESLRLYGEPQQNPFRHGAKDVAAAWRRGYIAGAFRG